MPLFIALTTPMILISMLLNYTLHGERVEQGKLIRIIMVKYFIFALLLYIMCIGEMVEKIILSGVFIVTLIIVDYLHYFLVTRLYRIIPISAQGFLEGITRCMEYILIPVTLFGTIYLVDTILRY